MAQQKEIVVETVHLTKTFQDFWRRPRVRAVDDLSLEVRRGEVFGLLGPNGSGKSTVLKLILGLLFPTQGSVAILGRHPRNQRMKELIGFLPEDSYLYKYLNAEETLDFYGRLFDMPRAKRQARSERLLEMVGLTPHRRRPLGQYSKGMARRIGLAQALINDPELLLLDEPTSGLDPIGTREMKDLVLELKKRGKTVFMCSHLLADVEDVCDRIAIMYGGKLRVMGTVDELLEQRSITRIETDDLPEEEIVELKAFLRRGHPERKVTIGKPMVRLEEYFLGVVEDAREEEPVSTGAMAGKGAGMFWDGEDEDEGAAAAVIDSLVEQPVEETQEEETQAPEDAETVVSETETEDRERPMILGDLVSAAPAPQEEEAVVIGEERAEEEKDREDRRRKAQELLAEYVEAADEGDPEGDGERPE